MSDFDLSQSQAPAAGDLAPTTPSASPSAPSGAPIGATAPSEPTFEVTVNGKVEKVPLSELQKGYSRTQDYTQKTQRLAAERQQILNQVAEYEAALREVQSFLSDRDRVFQYARSMGASQQQAAAIADQASGSGSGNPDDILTRQDAQRLVQEMLQSAAPQLVGPAQQQMQALRLEMATREYQQVFDQKIAQLQQQHPELARLGARGAQMIRMEALQQRPQSVESALEALELAAQTLVGDFSNVLKQEAVAPNPLKQGIEPPGGQGILPAPQGNFKSIRDPRLREQVINDLTQMGLFTGNK